jgi:adenosylcobyric acid synthase
MREYDHGGHLTRLATMSGRAVDEILDFSANINPLGLPDWFRPLIGRTLESVVHYPDPDCSKVVEAVSSRYRAAADEVLVGNGSTELIYLIPRVTGSRRAVIPMPAYVDYAKASTLAGLHVEPMVLRESNGFALDLSQLGSLIQDRDLVFVCRPNNPTGLVCDAEALRSLAAEHPQAVFVVDEAFGDFVDDFSSLTHQRPSNVIVLLSLTKIFAVPGLRLGCALADAGLAASVRRIQPTWSVNTMAQAVGAAAVLDADYIRLSRDFVRARREDLITALRAVPDLTVYPGTANFLLLRIDRKGMDAKTLAERLLSDGIAIRICSNFVGLDERFFRVAVRTAEENERLVESLGRVFQARAVTARKRHTPAIMFQGTSSNAGKSVLTAALGRILLQDGYRVAPFKAQNMSLNSCVTRTGGEMGRAQVMQAQACRLEPDVRMNPILLKPNSDTGSQVIVCGQPVGNMDVMEYVRYKPKAFDAAKEAYDSLASEHDVMVLEGAGSPAEVNLKHHDIVNMHMARYARAKVLVVGDIDRGGVFASFVGTMEVLSEWERSLISGFVVNRFRGDKSLLAEALAYTDKHTGRPVLGVVPYLHNHGLPEEDSVTFKSARGHDIPRTEDAVEIAIIDLPHISNFTDFDALRIEPDVRVIVARTPEDLNHPDAIIIPGSKNTIGDMQYVRDSGLADKIRHAHRSGHTEVVGICGGFQMIGSRIADPHRLESDGKAIEGLGFLDVTTVLAPEKTLTRMTGRHLDSGHPVTGYEIHHGQSDSSDMEPVLKTDDGRWDGAKSSDGMIWGTYAHGIFDEDRFRRWFIDRLRVRRGLPVSGTVHARYDLEPALNRLADAVRESLDIGRIYRMMGLS